MLTNTARTIATLGIWISVTIILVAGVFRANWNGDDAIFAMLLSVGLVCAAAAISTAFIWGALHRSAGPAADPTPRP